MSKFFTAIAVDVEGIRKLLPAGAYLEHVRFNPVLNQVEVCWDHGPFFTGKDFATEFSRECLEKRELPAGVGVRKSRERGGPSRSGQESGEPVKTLTRKAKGKARPAIVDSE